ncbi:hypothetical protein [Bacillus toyonensis]|uniref:hypothetical protein n=1 Tax=Bacillus toyonensis TaxID=155322 RepID=UPI0021D20242|nr:hypothetical protein [Bacillus toyonensis]MCU5181614.1 hypothetical protein [Bacillus toyonensis]
MENKEVKLFLLGVLGILVLSFGVWSGTWLGLAWIISFLFKLDVSYMTVFTISSIVWVLVIVVKGIFAYLAKRITDNL